MSIVIEDQLINEVLATVDSHNKDYHFKRAIEQTLEHTNPYFMMRKLSEFNILVDNRHVNTSSMTRPELLLDIIQHTLNSDTRKIIFPDLPVQKQVRKLERINIYIPYGLNDEDRAKYINEARAILRLQERIRRAQEDNEDDIDIRYLKVLIAESNEAAQEIARNGVQLTHQDQM